MTFYNKLRGFGDETVQFHHSGGDKFDPNTHGMLGEASTISIKVTLMTASGSLVVSRRLLGFMSRWYT